MCDNCLLNPPAQWRLEQEGLRAQRAHGDWEKSTDPIDHASIDSERFPEQVPSKVRRAIRAFLASGNDFAVVPEQTVTTVNQSLTILGLDADVYAESRSGETVVRRCSL